MKAIVLGGGAWGTALALLLHHNGHRVTLWCRDAEKAAQLQDSRRNPRLAGVRLPAALQVTGEAEAAREAELAIFAVPSFALRETAARFAPLLPPAALLVSAAKGLERESLLRMTEIVQAETGLPAAALSGPSHAEEVARRLPTGCIVAAASPQLALDVQGALMNAHFRVYTNADVVGVELCGTVKNIIALGCGITDGLGFGDNAKALLITRATFEAAAFIRAAGGAVSTCAGLAGIGDLIVTCTSRHSRNHRAGLLIGKGRDAAQAMREVGAVVEGYYAAESIRQLAARLDADMPICGSIYRILYQDLEPREAMRALMSREPKPEFWP